MSNVPFGAPSVVTTAAVGAASVFAADVDGDGDLDTLSASSGDNTIAWYENTAGDGSSWTPRTITTAADGAQSVFATDVDGDGDLDVLSASAGDNKIAWYENTAGDGTAWTARTITTTADGARSVFAADVDGDGDLDVLSASYNDNKIAWYENFAGDGTLWIPRAITTAADAAYSVFAADVDGDGDLDVLSASQADDKIAWYENTAGNGTAWTPRTITTAAYGAVSVFAADVDGDGDLDALSASFYDNKIAWYENTAGDGTAWTPRTISTAALGALSVVAADVDGDGDLDVLSASIFDNKIAWYENTAGDGTAWTPRTISTAAFGALSVVAADVDGDGDPDPLSASQGNNTIAWYENLGGDDTVGLFDPAAGGFFLKNTNSAGVGDLIFRYGPAGAGWTPVVGDWDNNPTDTAGLFDPVSGTFFLKNSNSAGPGDLVFRYGPTGSGWTPIVGDWDGDGDDTVGLFDPVSGTFFLRNSNTAGVGDLVFRYGPAGAGFTPVTGDWNGDDIDTVGLYNPVSGTFFLKNSNTAGVGDLVFRYGPAGAGWLPVVGDWDAGVASAAVAVALSPAGSTAETEEILLGEIAASLVMTPVLDSAIQAIGAKQTEDDGRTAESGVAEVPESPAAFTSPGAGAAIEATELELGFERPSSEDAALDVALSELTAEWSLPL